MSKCLAMAGMALAAGLLGLPVMAEHRTAQLTDKDRREIRELATSYGRALGLCAAEEYAALFAAPDGYFASGPRGKVVGRARLIALVRGERHCNDGSERRPRNLPADNTIEATPDRSKGRAVLKNVPGQPQEPDVKTWE